MATMKQDREQLALIDKKPIQSADTITKCRPRENILCSYYMIAENAHSDLIIRKLFGMGNKNMKYNTITAGGIGIRRTFHTTRTRTIQ